MAGTLSGGEHDAQLRAGAFARGDECGIAAHLRDQPLGALLPGFHVAREMHAAHHALPREFGGARQQRVAPLGNQFRE